MKFRTAVVGTVRAKPTSVVQKVAAVVQRLAAPRKPVQTVPSPTLEHMTELIKNPHDRSDIVRQELELSRKGANS
jgi:hypothetical protein